MVKVFKDRHGRPEKCDYCGKLATWRRGRYDMGMTVLCACDEHQEQAEKDNDALVIKENYGI